MRRVLTYLTIIAVVAFGQTDQFDINVTVEYIGLELFDLNNNPFSEFYTDTLWPSDTLKPDSSMGIRLDNQSNIPVGFLAWAYDDTAFCSAESLLWTVDTFLNRKDTCLVGMALYTAPREPNISNVIWFLQNSRIITTGLAPGEDRFGYLYFIAPADTGIYHEGVHKVTIIIGVYPE